jgi:peptidyl-prolyl cis-trans isomerase B (cyclophilin B)
MDNSTETVYRVDGDDVYYSYAENGETMIQRWFVDNYLYKATPDYNEKVSMTAEEHRAKLGTPAGGNILLALEDSVFEAVPFQKSEDLYVLEFSLSVEQYKQYVGADIIEPATYSVYFDSNATLVRMHMSAKQTVYGMFLVEGTTDIYLKNVGTTAPIEAPANADEFRVPPAYADIDFSTIDSLDGVVASDVSTDYVKIDVKDMGSIVIRLYPDVAPKSVANFKHLVSENFYDGVIFHRVIKDFMIQGGSPKGDSVSGSDTNIFGEFSSNGFTNNLLHVRGVVSMARSNDPNSASSQFFIVHKDSSNLDGNYAAFGYVVYGMDVVDAIATAQTDSSDKPLSDIAIETVSFVTINN